MLKAGLISIIRLARTIIVGAFNILFALILLFEEWGWQPLLAAFRWLERYRIVARVEAWIAALPPYGALAIFVAPSAILLPVKFIGLWLLANGQLLAAGLLLVLAKIASTALVARIFMLTQPALMQLAWFARLYHWFIPWKEELFARVRASFAWRYGRILKARMAKEVRQRMAVLRPVAVAAMAAARARLHILGRVGLREAHRALSYLRERWNEWRNSSGW